MMLTKAMKRSVVDAVRQVLEKEQEKLVPPKPPRFIREKWISNTGAALTERQSADYEKWTKRKAKHRKRVKELDQEVTQILRNLEAVLEPLESVVELLTVHPQLYLYLNPLYRKPVEESLPDLTQEEIDQIVRW